MASDCSGNAGMVVAGGDEFGWKDWTGSELGDAKRRGIRMRDGNKGNHSKHFIVVYCERMGGDGRVSGGGEGCVTLKSGALGRGREVEVIALLGGASEKRKFGTSDAISNYLITMFTKYFNYIYTIISFYINFVH